MPEPLAFFLTWSCYGTWLPGDERGWVMRGIGFQPPDAEREERARSMMTESPITLDQEQRRLVEKTVRDHCRIRQWKIHALNCRTNHVHVIVTADRDPEVVREQLKAWCTRALKDLQRARSPCQPVRKNWWTERGSIRPIGDEVSLEEAIQYVRDGQ